MLSRAAAEALMDGGPGPERLRCVLTVAAGPAEPDELRGEAAARLAFRTAAEAWPVSGTVDDPVRRRARTMSRIVAAKVIAAVALTVGAGGVAVAATTSSFPGGPFGAPTGQRSGPAPDDVHRTLVVDEVSGSTSRDAAEPAPRTTDASGAGGYSGGTGPCRYGAAQDCAAPPAATPTTPPSRPTSTPVGGAPVSSAPVSSAPGSSAPVGGAAVDGEPAVPPPARSSHAADTTKKKNPKAGHPTSKPPKPQPPGQAKKADAGAEEPAAGQGAED
jgi:hypothetical protein